MPRLEPLLFLLSTPRVFVLKSKVKSSTSTSSGSCPDDDRRVHKKNSPRVYGRPSPAKKSKACRTSKTMVESAPARAKPTWKCVCPRLLGFAPCHSPLVPRACCTLFSLLLLSSEKRRNRRAGGGDKNSLCGRAASHIDPASELFGIQFTL